MSNPRLSVRWTIERLDRENSAPIVPRLILFSAVGMLKIMFYYVKFGIYFAIYFLLPPLLVTTRLYASLPLPDIILFLFKFLFSNIVATDIDPG